MAYLSDSEIESLLNDNVSEEEIVDYLARPDDTEPEPEPDSGTSWLDSARDLAGDAYSYVKDSVFDRMPEAITSGAAKTAGGAIDAVAEGLYNVDQTVGDIITDIPYIGPRLKDDIAQNGALRLNDLIYGARDFGKELYATGQRLGEEARDGIEPGTWRSAALSAGEMTAPLVATTVTGGAGAIPIFGADTFAKEYGARVADGSDPSDAALESLPYAGIAAAQGIFPAKILQKAPKLATSAWGVGTGVLGGEASMALQEAEMGQPLSSEDKWAMRRENAMLIPIIGAYTKGLSGARNAATSLKHDLFSRPVNVELSSPAIEGEVLPPEMLALDYKERPALDYNERLMLDAPEGIYGPELAFRASQPYDTPMAPDATIPIDPSLSQYTAEGIYPIIEKTARPPIVRPVPEYIDSAEGALGYEADSPVPFANRAYPKQETNPAIVELPEAPPPEATKPIVPAKERIDADKIQAEKTFAEPVKEAATKVEEAKPVANKDKTSVLDGLKTVELPVDNIVLSKDVPNVKRRADPNSGIIPEEQLQGKYERLATAPIVVWERENGALEVITGRHRLDLAKRSGEKTIPAQILREADGFTKEMAAVLDAEANIRDNKGGVDDYSTYFKHRRLGQEEARQRGLLSTDRGRKAFSIATRGSEEVYQLHQNERLTDAQAAAIAEAAPNNPTAQLQGIRAVEDGANLLEIGQRVRVAALIQSGDLQIVSSKGQGDWFGTSDTVAQSQEFQDRMGKFAAKHIYDLQEDIRALASQKRPDRAAKGGIQVDVKAATEKRSQLERELNDWLHWNTNKSLTEQLRREVLATGDQQKLKLSELGAIGDMPGESPFSTLGKEIGNIKEAVKRFYSQKTQKDLSDVLIENKGMGESPSAKFFTGELLGGVHKLLTFPRTIAEKFPIFRPLYELALGFERTTTSVASELGDILRPYYSLSNRRAVDAVLVAARKEKFPLTPERLQRIKVNGKLLTGEEIRAVQSVRSAMDTALVKLELALTENATTPEERQRIQYSIQAIKDGNYVPFSRFGRYALALRDADGKLEYFELFESKADRAKVAKKIKEKTGKTSEGFTLNKMTDPDAWAEYSMLLRSKTGAIDPAAQELIKKELNKSGFAFDGFSKHFLHADYVEGFSKDLSRPIADYVLGISKYIARKGYSDKFTKALEATNTPDTVNLYEYGKKYVDYVTGAEVGNPNLNKLSAMSRRFLTLMFLGYNPKSAALNLTQTFTMTHSELGKHVKHATPLLASSIKDAGTYFANKKAFKNRYGELSRDLESAIMGGYIDEAGVRQLADIRKGIDPEKTSLVDHSMWMFDGAEKFNRVTAFIAGWRAAQKNGLSGKARLDFAEDFVRTTQFDYSKANRPVVARGVGAPFMLFRLWGGNYLRAMRNDWQMFTNGKLLQNPKNWDRRGFEAFAKKTASMMALGGISAIPFATHVLIALKAGGFDADKYIRDYLQNGSMADALVGVMAQTGYEKDERDARNKIGSVVLQGLPTIGGASFSQSLQFTEGLPLLESASPFEAIGRSLLGVPAAYASQIGKAYDYMDKYGDYSDPETYYRAIEQVAPTALKNLMTSGRASGVSQDLGLINEPPGFRSMSGEPVLDNPTDWELFLKALSFQPSRLNERYSALESARMAGAYDNDNIYWKIAKTWMEQDYATSPEERAEAKAKEDRLWQEAEAKGINPNIGSIRDFRRTWDTVGYKAIKNAPKAKREAVINSLRGF